MPTGSGQRGDSGAGAGHELQCGEFATRFNWLGSGELPHCVAEPVQWTREGLEGELS